MKRNATLIAIFMLLTLSSCHRYYTSSRFDEKTARHKLIAVLPPKMVLTGNQPRNLSGYEIAQMEEKESKLFQEALFNNILKKGNQGKFDLGVELQPCANTLALLQKNNISLRESWEKEDAELTRVLGVDAVVRTSIEKDRVMSDLASAGIFAGKQIVDAVLNRNPVATPNVTKTADIRVSCSLVSNGETLWNDSYIRQSDFSFTANEIVERITSNFAMHFPYRRKV